MTPLKDHILECHQECCGSSQEFCKNATEFSDFLKLIGAEWLTESLSIMCKEWSAPGWIIRETTCSHTMSHVVMLTIKLSATILQSLSTMCHLIFHHRRVVEVDAIIQECSKSPSSQLCWGCQLGIWHNLSDVEIWQYPKSTPVNGQVSQVPSHAHHHQVWPNEYSSTIAPKTELE